MPTQHQFAPPRPLRSPPTTAPTVTVAVVDPAALPEVANAAAGDPRTVEVIPVNGVEDLAAARGSVVILCEPGVLPTAGALARLVGALSDHPHLGMVGGRVVPAGPPATLAERLDDTLRQLHHVVARERPRLDGLVAVRTRAITGDETSTAALEHAAHTQGLGLRYLDGPPVGTAVPPARVRDLLARRRAAVARREDARRRLGYAPATARPAAVAAAAVRLAVDQPGLVGTLILLSVVEVVATWWRWPASTPGSPRSTADRSTSSSLPATRSPAS